MGRIRDAYETKFRKLLQLLHPRRLELGVKLLLDRAERLSERNGTPLPHALAQVYERARQQVQRRQELLGSCPLTTDLRKEDLDSVEFVCDAGLGGLSRWLRAAGYAAHWTPAIDDDELIRQARTIPAILLTTDSLLMKRGVLRDGFVPALWVSPSLKKLEQLKLVLQELSLPVRQARCMSCGGNLREVAKESVRDRIPPKTYRWRDEYYLCARCGKLFWHGTHWESIENRLQSLA